jgi:hypothetical protein
MQITIFLFGRSAWKTNRFVCGSYSDFLPQTYQDDQEMLRKNFEPNGVRKSARLNMKMISLIYFQVPRITFAGEAMHSVYPGTVHGALESGFESAQKLVNFYLSLKD